MPLGISYNIIAGMSGINSVTAGFDAIGRRAHKTMDELGKSSARIALSVRYGTQAWSASATNIEKMAAGYHRLRYAMSEFRGVWDAQIQGIKKYTEASIRLNQSQQRLLALNLPADQHQKATRAIAETVRNLKGMRFDEVTESFIDLQMALGEVETAVQFLPLASKYRFNMKTLFGDLFTGKEVNRQILDTFKFLEQAGITAPHGAYNPETKQRGYTQDDINRQKEYLEVMGQITAGSQGTITGSTFRELIGRGGVSLQGISPTGLKTMGWVMQAMGGAQAGTALMAMFAKFVGGTIQQSAVRQLIELVGKENVDTSKMQFGKRHPGIPTKVQPGWFKQADLLQSNPLEFAKFMEEKLKARYGLDKTKMKPEEYQKKAVQTIYGITQQKNAARILADMIINSDVIEKEIIQTTRAKNISDQYAQSIESVTGRLEILKSYQENWRAITGNVMTSALGAMAEKWGSVLQRYTDFLAKNPEFAKWVGLAIVASKLFSGGFQSFLLWKFYSGTMAAKAEEGPAMTGVNPKTGQPWVKGKGGKFVSPTPAAIAAAEGGAPAKGLKGALRGGAFASIPASMVSMAGISFAADRIFAIAEAVSELDDALDGLGSALAGAEKATNDLKNAQKTTEERIAELKAKQTLTKAEKEELAEKEKILAKIKQTRELSAPGDAIAIMNAIRAGALGDRGTAPHTAILEDFAGELKDPVKMKAFIAGVLSGQGSFAGLNKELTLSYLQNTFAESFRQAVQQMGEDAAQTTGEVDKLGKSVGNLTIAAKAAKEMLDQLGLGPGKKPEVGPGQPKGGYEGPGPPPIASQVPTSWSGGQRGGMVFHIDARGAEKGAADRIKQELRAIVPEIIKELDNRTRAREWGTGGGTIV